MKTPTPESASVKWARVIADWRQSGLSVACFCERRALQRASFYAWRRRLADGDGDDGYGGGGGDAGCGGQAGVMAGGFIEARIVEASAAGPHVANPGELLERSASGCSGVWLELLPPHGAAVLDPGLSFQQHLPLPPLTPLTPLSAHPRLPSTSCLAPRGPRIGIRIGIARGFDAAVLRDVVAVLTTAVPTTAAPTAFASASTAAACIAASGVPAAPPAHHRTVGAAR